jgi:hypothetical protein
MERIVVELRRDSGTRTMFYRATDEQGRHGDSDRVKAFRDFHAQTSLATQAVSRLGERLESAS